MAVPLLVLRSDGGPGIGNGHVLRSLALAQVWVAKGGRAVLASVALPGQLRARLEASGVEAMTLDGERDDSAGLLTLTEVLRPSWVVLDGYQFGPAYQEALADKVPRLCIVDDHASLGRYHATLVVDQNLGATDVEYRCRPPGSEVLTGIRYVLLREEYLKWREPERPVKGQVQRVLVALGGSPTDYAVALASQAVAAAGLMQHSTFLTGGAVVSDMPSLLAECDLALSAAGSMAWELCFMGVPSIMMPLAENQRPIAHRLAAAGAAVGVSGEIDVAGLARELKALASDAPRRLELSRRARQLVDGRGARRVVTALKRRLLSLRPAQAEDSLRLWEWANDAAVRAASFSTDPIPWSVHQDWFDRRLADPNTRIFMVSDDGGDDVGQIRFERADDSAEVAVSIAPTRRGEGWAPALIDAATASVLADGWLERVDAWIRSGNAGSRLSFEDAGYHLVGEGTVQDSAAVHYVRKRPAGPLAAV